MAEQQRKIPYMLIIISYPALFVNFNRAFRMALYGFCKGSFHFSFSFHLEDIYYIFGRQNDNFSFFMLSFEYTIIFFYKIPKL